MQDNSWRDAFKAKFKPRWKVFKNSSHVSCIEGFKFGKHLPTAAQLFEPFNFGGIHKSFCDDEDPQRVRETIIVQAVANLLINQNYPDSGKPLVKIILILHQQHMDNFPLYILFWSWSWWYDDDVMIRRWSFVSLRWNDGGREPGVKTREDFYCNTLPSTSLFTLRYGV